MSVFRTICSRGLHTINGLIPASRIEFDRAQRTLHPAMVQVNNFLIPNHYATLKLSPYQVALAKQAEDCWLLQLSYLGKSDSNTIGIFQIRKSSVGFNLRDNTSTRLFSAVAQHVFAEKQPEIHSSSTYGTKLDLHLLSSKDKMAVEAEMELLFLNLTSTTIVRSARLGDLIYFFDEEDADSTATSLFATIDTNKRNEDGKLLLEFVSVGTRERAQFRELLTAITAKEQKERKELAMQILGNKV